MTGEITEVGRMDWAIVISVIVGIGGLILGLLKTWWDREEKRAKVVLRRYSNGSGFALLANPKVGAFMPTLLNEGPAVAHELRIHASFPNGQSYSSGLHRVVHPLEEVPTIIEFPPTAVGTSLDTPISIDFTWRDSRRRRAKMAIRIVGAWREGPTVRIVE